MFYESGYPKKELKEISQQLSKYKTRFLLYNIWQYNLEKSCFIWFYFIRKLIESQFKVTDKIRKMLIEVETCKFIWKKRLSHPFWSYDEYDFENPTKEIINLKELTHQFIHSQLFFGIKKHKWLTHIYVTSDFKIYDKLYKVNLDDIIKIFNIVSEDFVTSTTCQFDDKTGKVIIECK